jgi:hypothetical protein
VGNREQLDELLNHFSIEANNPAVCMGQVLAALSPHVCRLLTTGERSCTQFKLQSRPCPPVVQDVCRQFASETSGKKKYELFMQVSWASTSGQQPASGCFGS